MKTLAPVSILKEQVPELQFPTEDVIASPTERSHRRRMLERCTKLGNLSKGKVHIVFEDNEELKEVYTTIWATTEHNVVLKRNACIPIHRVHRVYSV